jgi:hypothetical protein
MPAGVVTDEKKWEKAKSIAKKEGKGDNWAYVVGICQQMGGCKEATNEDIVNLITDYLLEAEKPSDDETTLDIGPETAGDDEEET